MKNCENVTQQYVKNQTREILFETKGKNELNPRFFAADHKKISFLTSEQTQQEKFHQRTQNKLPQMGSLECRNSTSSQLTTSGASPSLKSSVDDDDGVWQQTRRETLPEYNNNTDSQSTTHQQQQQTPFARLTVDPAKKIAQLQRMKEECGINLQRAQPTKLYDAMQRKRPFVRPVFN